MKAAFDQVYHLLQVVRQQEPTTEGLQLLDDSGFQSDLLEAAEKGTLNTERRNEFRNVLGLAPLMSSSLRDLGPILTIPPQPECVVANCFTDKKVFAWRDPDFDSREWLPETLPASGEVKVTGHELTKVTTEEAMAKVGGKVTNLLQIEDLIVKTEKGKKTGLDTIGNTNIFFLQVDASVFTVHALRCAGGWYVYLFRFRPRCVWRTVFRFFSPAT